MDILIHSGVVEFSYWGLVGNERMYYTGVMGLIAPCSLLVTSKFGQLISG